VGDRPPGPFAEALVGALAGRDVSQQALADRIGVTRASVNDWCRGRAVPGPDTVFAIERALGIAAGRLSRILGYVPASAVRRGEVADVVDAIKGDPELDDGARRTLLLIYEQLKQRG